MLKPVATLALGLALTINTLSGCKGDANKQANTVKKTATDVSVVANNVGDGLDLSQLPELVRRAKNGEELEKLLNSSGVNNLDLNQDGNVDYLNVEEFRDKGQQGFILFTNENNQREDIAQVTISRNGDQGEVAVQGNPNYYPDQMIYRSQFPWAEILLAAWLLDLSRPRFYHPPYYYGYYPPYYRVYRVVPRSAYRAHLKSSSYRKQFGGSRAVTTSRWTGRFGSSSFGKSSIGQVTTTTRSGMNQSRNSLSQISGSSFNRTTNKRPAGSGAMDTTGFGSSSSRSRTSVGSSDGRSGTGFGFGSSSSRSYTGSSFGSSSNRSRSGFSSFSGSGFGSSSRSSFGGSSRRRR